MKNKNFDKAMAPGIPDHFFERGNIPMTKEEIRVVTLSKGNLRDDSIVYDLGAGTGSITIEAALQASKGQVFALERVEEGVGLIKANIERFGVSNVTVLHNEAPKGIEGLPPADCIFIGGSGGHLEEILVCCDSQLKEGGRLVLNAITMETLWNSVRILEALGGYELDITSLAVTRIEKVGRSHMFKGLNPVFIITAEKETADER